MSKEVFFHLSEIALFYYLPTPLFLKKISRLRLKNSQCNVTMGWGVVGVVHGTFNKKIF